MTNRIQSYLATDSWCIIRVGYKPVAGFQQYFWGAILESLYTLVKMLGPVDYSIFALTLTLSFGISLYFGCFGSKQKTAKQYLYGIGKFQAIPIGLSLLGSAISANPIIGTISEVYVFGTQFLVTGLSSIISVLLIWKFILPVFCGNLKLTVPYEYFELRFNTRVRLILSLIYIFQILIYPSCVLYVSSMTFSEFSGLPLYLCSIIIGSICTSYTILGGFAGVIWTDVLQICLIIVSCLFTLFRGLSSAGGISNVWFEANEGQRIQFFNMDPNPFVRLTFWSGLIGMSVINIAHSACASSGIQRYMALNNEKDARISTSILACGIIFTCYVSGLIGLCIYVIYKDCDPIKSKKIVNASQLLSYFINDLPEDSVGFKGLFTAGILSAGLSTLSAELNAVSGLLYYDIVQKYFKVTHNELKATLIMKGTILAFGTVHIILAPVIQYFKHFMQFSLSISSWTYGAKVGVMLLATTFPKANSWGAITGMITSIFTVGWISINAMYYDLASSYVLPVSVSNCSDTFNFTMLTTNITINQISSLTQQNDNFPVIYQLSFMYYGLLGMIVTVVVGMIVSYITGPNDVNKMDPRLIIPCVRPVCRDSVSLQNTM